MSRDGCLKRHLLHASVECYHQDPLYSGPARWTERPAAVRPTASSGSEIDLALVGRFDEGIVVAFRGTLPPLDLSPDLRRIVGPDIVGPQVIADWLNDLNYAPSSNVTIGGVTLPGGVHRGLAGSLARLWAGVAAEVTRLRRAHPAGNLYFTGHSKGGALANLGAVLARRLWPDAGVKVVTFGAARTGDSDFARHYREAGIDCHRYEVTGDKITDLPPGHVPVGTLHVLAPIHHPRPTRPVAFVRAMIRREDQRWLVPPVIAAHLPYPGFGYGEHVCEPECRHDWR
ncbi:MAG TPA: lipase family protein [Allosphingosinicella sp.]|nr:lipase family protein [Allosphingosinicella sp.]